MEYTSDKLLSELRRCYEENGKVTVKILNNPENNYPTQPTYRKHFGSINEAKSKVGIKRNMTKEEIRDSINSIINSGNNVSLKQLKNHEIEPSQLYAHFDSINDAISFATGKDADQFYRSKYLSIIDEFENISWEKINKCEKLPSQSTILKYFDSIDDIKEELGREIQESYKQRAKNLIEEYDPQINYSDDGYIYCYEFTLYDERAFYVGETTNILNTIKSHLRRKKIQTKSHTSNGKILCRRGQESDNIKIHKIHTIIPLQKGENESIEDFTRRRLYQENKLRNIIVMEEDTLNVYGG